MRKFLYLLFHAVNALKRWVKSNPRFASFVADIRNLKSFENTNLHEIMLCDTVRVESYYKGISRVVKDGDVVVDVGTGSGILAFFAAKRAAEVHAIEQASIIKVARAIAKENNIANVEFHHGNSRQFRMNGKADVIVHEQIGNYVFDENMVEAILDLRRRVLRAGGRIIPNQFEVFLEPIEMKDEYHTPYMWEMNIHDITFRSTMGLENAQPGRGKPIAEYHRIEFVAAEVKQMLCEPKPIVQFDLETMDESDLPMSIRYENTVVRNGLVHGLCIGFKANFDDEVGFEVMPTGRQTNWAFTLFRLEECEVRAGQRIAYDLEFGDVRDCLTWRLTWHGTNSSAASAAE